MLTKTKMFSGIIISIFGIVLLIASFIIKSQVSSGRERISEAKSNVQTSQKLFSLTPVTKEFGKGLTGSAERQIREGSAKADTYDTIALWFQIGGGVFIVIGAGLVVMSFVGRSKKS